MLSLKLFTSESTQDILLKGGSFSWKLNTSKANLCSYAILYQNARARSGPKAAAHRDGFLVGRIVALKPEPEGRHAVIFDAVADLPIGEQWPVGHQNPVNYADVDEGFFAGLDFKPVSGVVEAAPARTELPPTEGGLSIAQAKRLLAAHYGVEPDAIEITIRG